MTKEQNVKAIIECSFAGFQDEIIENATNRIIDIMNRSEEVTYAYYPYNYCPHCGEKLIDKTTTVGRMQVEE